MKILKNIANKVFHGSAKKNIGTVYESIAAYLDDSSLASTSKGFSYYCNDAYSKNVIVNRCVSLIASSAASVSWLLYAKQGNAHKVIKHHKILDLLKRPNPSYAGAEFFENIYAYKLLSGNAYILAVRDNKGEVRELYFLRPDRVEVVPGKNALPLGYIYRIGESKRYYPVDPVTGQSDILHLKNFHPLDDWYGQSAIIAAGGSIDLHNQAVHWNNTLLKNGARPSGAFIVKNADMAPLTDDQYERLVGQVRSMQQAGNIGRPMLLEENIEWKELSMSPKDMDFLESKNSAARDIALSLGVPPQLLAIKGDNTYSNMQEARLALWEETVLPLLDHTIDSLNSWLVKVIDKNIELSYDHNGISALSIRQEKNWQRIANAGFLSDEEKRALLGI